MRATVHVAVGFLVAMFGTMVFSSFIMVFDELFNLAMYCGQSCTYPFPWSQPLGLWAAWVWAFAAVLTGVAMMVFGTANFVYGATKLRGGG